MRFSAAASAFAVRTPLYEYSLLCIEGYEACHRKSITCPSAIMLLNGLDILILGCKFPAQPNWSLDSLSLLKSIQNIQKSPVHFYTLQHLSLINGPLVKVCQLTPIGEDVHFNPNANLS